MDIIFCKKLGSRRILIMSKQKKERDNVNGAQMSLVSAEKAVLICPCSFSSALLCLLEPVWLCGWTCFWSNFNLFFFAKIECGLYFLDRFDVLISKIIFKKWKNIIGTYFGTKSYLKSNHYHTAKHPLIINLYRGNREKRFFYYKCIIDIKMIWK